MNDKIEMKYTKNLNYRSILVLYVRLNLYLQDDWYWPLEILSDSEKINGIPFTNENATSSSDLFASYLEFLLREYCVVENLSLWRNLISIIFAGSWYCFRFIILYRTFQLWSHGLRHRCWCKCWSELTRNDESCYWYLEQES